MVVETTRELEALEAQAKTLMNVFATAGHEAVAPAIIQPADVFLDVVGESLRARTYVFTDPDGAELCLRPDLTVPTCRLHLARHVDPATPARYCYNGAAFRIQPVDADAAHPREFRQAGFERFGDVAREEAEAKTISLVVTALEKAGLTTWTLKLGDLGLFSSVLDEAGLSPRWKKRLDDAFLRPRAFREALKAFTRGVRSAPLALPDSLLSSLDRENTEPSEAAVLAYLEEKGIELFGTRALADITANLVTIAEGREETPLDETAAKLISDYIDVSGPARTAGAKIARLLKGARAGSGAALETYDRRLALLSNAGIDLDRVMFSAEYGRTLDYYTGLVFEVHTGTAGTGSPVANGGRYDALMRAAGANADIPAVGAAIHTERLLAAVRGGSL